MATLGDWNHRRDPNSRSVQIIKLMENKPMSNAKPGAVYIFRETEDKRWEWAEVDPAEASELFPPRPTAKFETIQDAIDNALGGRDEGPN